MPKYKPLPPLERLNQLLTVVDISPDKYGESSGLVWKIDRSRNAKAGQVAGNLKAHHSREDKFYWEVMIDGKSYYVARVVYYMVYNKDPKNVQVDHKDRNTYNNNSYNLRLDVKGDIQIANQSTRSNNKSGVSNVNWHKRLKRWQAYLCVRGQRTHLGTFICKLEAARVVYNAYIEHQLDKKGRDLPDLTKVECACDSCKERLLE